MKAKQVSVAERLLLQRDKLEAGLKRGFIYGFSLQNLPSDQSAAAGIDGHEYMDQARDKVYYRASAQLKNHARTLIARIDRKLEELGVGPPKGVGK